MIAIKYVFNEYPLRIQFISPRLTKEVGCENENDHEDCESEKADFQIFVDLTTELDGLKTLPLKNGSVVITMVVVVIGRGVRGVV